MSISYLEAISTGFPTVQCHTSGDTYADLIWDAGDPIPTQVDLDAWIAAHPNGTLYLELTKYQFRKLFTFNERVAIDNVGLNASIPANYRASLLTIAKDMELSAIVELDNPDTAQGLGFLTQLGLLAPGRMYQILANTPPV
jgi:hypothetical protein